MSTNASEQTAERSRVASFSPFTGRRCRQADEGRRRRRSLSARLSTSALPLIRPFGPPSPRERGEGKGRA
ncbi:hypothetical protein EOD10_26685 [Mesorhizobium sp. M7A.T.Ca.TU.009.01.3.2]|nr:hypothetical protein EOD10_26685 [Mesorhizobium sp. M7A.T.Ca.TU.009.01.3.2]RUV09368.1 hypothetical protein EOD00_15720 [Mesorhizobium sp. M7A.T.Ca.TU.009.01.3.1]RUY32724.1 hypothetical protein EN984_01700 [Mesorhizobium sp. M7A.F.Ca.CA.004.12.1.1]RUY92101.1 hypothetical protein EN964_04915 [Mesorhizobium sp. M7A.F.Ca.CA.001.10.2.1]RUZ91005.1 hypothetical protein EN944_25685 [Mesorhizobium sp. M7A.F.Ca.US.006.01.2.1]RVA16052.1 hypothetical protein EN939_15225 [Mesorhizobium sp. M7A.F.Ca.CA.0